MHYNICKSSLLRNIYYRTCVYLDYDQLSSTTIIFIFALYLIFTYLINFFWLNLKITKDGNIIIYKYNQQYN